jgi:DNA-binding IclR family transcriptional regulator
LKQIPRASSALAPSEQKYMVPVVQSTFKILEELASGGTLGLNEITVRTGISKSTVFRVLATLGALGYVVRDQERNYHVSQIIGDLASSNTAIETIRSAALPHLLFLRDLYGETVNLGRMQLDKVVYIEVVPSDYALRFHERPGASVAWHSSALGKVIVAFADEEVVSGYMAAQDLQPLTRNTVTDPQQLRTELKRIRDRGYAFDRGETSLPATCVAAPIQDAAGRAVAAISISGPNSRFNPRKGAPVIESLLKTVGEISSALKAPSSDKKPAQSTAATTKASRVRRRQS